MDTPEPTEAQKQLKAVCLHYTKTLQKAEALLREEPSARRDNAIRKLLKMHEVVNDEAMRVGLNASAQFIAQAKTGRVRTASAKGERQSPEPRLQTPFSQLMAHHAKNFIGGITDGGAQGKAIKWILERFTPELAIQRYDLQVQEAQGRYRVSWLTVQKDIGRIQPNVVRPLDAAERNAARHSQNLEFIEDLRGGSGPDYH